MPSKVKARKPEEKPKSAKAQGKAPEKPSKVQQRAASSSGSDEEEAEQQDSEDEEASESGASDEEEEEGSSGSEDDEEEDEPALGPDGDLVADLALHARVRAQLHDLPG